MLLPPRLPAPAVSLQLQEGPHMQSVGPCSTSPCSMLPVPHSSASTARVGCSALLPGTEREGRKEKEKKAAQEALWSPCEEQNCLYLSCPCLLSYLHGVALSLTLLSFLTNSFAGVFSLTETPGKAGPHVAYDAYGPWESPERSTACRSPCPPQCFQVQILEAPEHYRNPEVPQYLQTQSLTE